MDALAFMTPLRHFDPNVRGLVPCAVERSGILLRRKQIDYLSTIDLVLASEMNGDGLMTWLECLSSSKLRQPFKH